jgi:hypothetical protein
VATLTVKQSGGDYSSLSAALSAASNGDVISIEGTWTVDDSSAATISDDVTIETDEDSKHPGYYDTSQNHYRLRHTGGSHALTLSGSYTATIDGVVIVQASSGGTSDECFRCVPGTSDTVTIKNSILICELNVLQQDCIYTGFGTAIGTVTVENSILYGAARAGIHSQNNYQYSSDSGTINVNSCAIWNCGRWDDGSPGFGDIGGGIQVSANDYGNYSNFDISVHNTIVVENDTGTGGVASVSPADYHFSNAYASSNNNDANWQISYSMDSDNSIASRDSGGVGNLASRTATDSTSPGTGAWVIFEDITTDYDLRLVDNAENDAQNAHLVATAEGLTIPSTDIVGTSRPQNTNYDLGPFEIVYSSVAFAGSPSYVEIDTGLSQSGSQALTIPADCDAILVVSGDWSSGDANNNLDELNFDNGVTNDFTTIIERDGAGSEYNAYAYIMTASDSDWPGDWQQNAILPVFDHAQ